MSDQLYHKYSIHKRDYNLYGPVSICLMSISS